MARLKLLLLALLITISTNSLALTEEDNKEILHASEAAPEYITKNSSFMRFRDGRFVTIKKGSGNFTCLVVRDPNGRYEPSCFNEQAMRSVFFTYELQMRLLYKGHSYEQTSKKLKEEFESGNIPTAETGSLVYMMSPNNKMYDKKKQALRSTPVHQMYFFPKLEDKIFSLYSGSPSLWQGFPHLSALIVIVNKGRKMR